MAIDAPLELVHETVRPEWTDYNGHMNMAYFVLLFDQASHAFYPIVGLGEPYRDRTNHSTFAADGLITFSREGRRGDAVSVTTQLIDYDEKRLHYFHVMRNADKEYQMATMELMALHVDLESRKVAPMPPDVMERLAIVQAAHADLPRPRELGRTIGIKRAPAG